MTYVCGFTTKKELYKGMNGIEYNNPKTILIEAPDKKKAREIAKRHCEIVLWVKEGK